MVRTLPFALVLLAFSHAHAQPDPAAVYAWFKGDAGLLVGADQYLIERWTNYGTKPIEGISCSARDLYRLTGLPQKTWLRLADDLLAGALALDGNDGIWSAKTEFGTISTNRTLILCARVFDGANQGFLFDASSFSPGLTRAQVKDGFWQVATAGATNTSFGPATGTPTATVVTDIWQVHSFVVVTNATGARFRHFTNSVLAADVLLATNGSLSGFMLGANVAQQFGIKADVAEVLVFDRALESRERNSIETYLSGKWFGAVADPDAPPRPEQDRVAVFEKGMNGYACFRIPAMVTSARGTVIAVADGRISGCGDIPNPLDLVARRSYDNGRTWTPLQVIANYGSDPSDTDVYPAYGTTNPIPRVSGGDAALLLDNTNGRVWVLYDNGGNSGGRKIKLEMRYSDDDGTNWSPALDIEALNPGLRPPGGEFLAGPGNGIQLTEGPLAGRLIFPVYSYGTPSSSRIIYSDDDGTTWRLGGIAGAGGGEIQVVETSGGGLLASMRDNNFSTSGVRTFSRSADGGITWSEPYTSTAGQPALPDPACQASILRLTTTNDSNASRIVFANAASSSSRIKMTLRISYDEGQTWPVSNLVYAGSSAYSALAKLASGEIGLLFESDNYTRIDFVRRSVSQLTAAADSLPPYTVWAGKNFTPEQLMDPGVSAPEADADDDRLKNRSEFSAGTDPLDPASRFTLRWEAASSGIPKLTFLAAADRSYSVEYRTEPATGPWQLFAVVPPVDSNTLVEIPASPTNPVAWFRLMVPEL